MGRPKQTSAVIDAILSQIEDGSLLPGSPVSEKDLIETCSVSRTPVREALIHLEASGLIVRHPRKGASIFHPTTDEFLTILEVHANLEAHAAQLAAQRISPDQKRIIQQRTEDCVGFAKTADAEVRTEYYGLNMQFHAIIADASCNPVLIEMIKMNARKLMAHYRLRYRTPGAIETSAAEHAHITSCILAQDGEAARQAMLAHFNYERETVMDMIASVS